MAIVENLTHINGTDKEFDLIAKFSKSQLTKDLSAFVGVTAGDALSLYLEGEDDTIILTLDDSANGRLSVVDATSALAGQVHVVFKDALLLKAKTSSNMELRIKEGAGPDFQVSCVQYEGKLVVKKKLFD